MLYNCMCNDNIRIVSGETCEFCFHVKINGRLPLMTKGVKAGLSFSHYSDIYMPPIVSLTGRVNVSPIDENIVDSISFSLSSEDCLKLSMGKYVYQVTVMDMDKNVDIPNSGFLFVVNNINKKFLGGN